MEENKAKSSTFEDLCDSNQPPKPIEALVSLAASEMEKEKAKVSTLEDLHDSTQPPKLTEVTVCDTCGDVGVDSLLVSCNKCTDGAVHTYCMRVKLFEKPKSWTCEDCAPAEGTNKLVEDDIEVGSRRHGVPLEAPTAQKARATERRAVSSGSSDWFKLCDTCGGVGDESLLVSCNKCTDGAEHTYCMRVKLFEKPKSWTCQDCEPRAGTNRLVQDDIEVGTRRKTGHLTKRRAGEPPSKKLGNAKLGAAGSLLKSNSSKTANLKPKGQNAKVGCLQKQKVEGNPAFHDDRKGKGPIAVSKSMRSEHAFLEESNATGLKVVLADAYEFSNPAMSLQASDSAVTAEKNGKEDISGGGTSTDAYEVINPSMSLPTSDSAVTADENEQQAISGGERFSEFSFCNLDAVGSSPQLDPRLWPSNTHIDSNCTDIKKRNVSQQAEHPARAAAAMSMSKLCTGLPSDERSHLRDLAQVEAATVLQGLVYPNNDHSWLGKFQIHNSDGIARNCDGFQAHLSSCASHKVLEVVGRLPEIIILEELPRLRIWPSQFMGSQGTGKSSQVPRLLAGVTEENIALYFFAKDADSYETYYRGLINWMINNDLALKGNLDGVELLIFPSNILPERSQRWNQMMFLWGVFNVQMVNNSANTPVSNSVKQGNGDTVKRRELFDLNVCPEDEDDDSVDVVEKN